jgi:hypothetical protein
LYDVVMRLRPVPGLRQPPAIDDVANEIEILGVGFPQELQQ